MTLVLFFKLLSHFSIPIDELLMTPNASLLTYFRGNMLLLQQYEAVVFSNLAIPTRALTLWWQRGRMKLCLLSGTLRKWT